MVFKNSALKYLIISTVLILSACASHVNFKGYSFKPGEDLNLSGTIYKPRGDGPFPAVVILHGCSGIGNRTYLWASRLKGWGYVSFIVDSLGPRGVHDTCQRTPKVSYVKRAIGFSPKKMDTVKSKLLIS